MSARFSDCDSDGIEHCIVNLYDELREPLKPAVRTRFTCSYLDNNDSIAAYYDGSTLFGYALPYLTFSDVTKLKSQVSGVRIVEGQVPHPRYAVGGRKIFEILPDGYEWGEHITASPEFLDLGYSVIEVYSFSGPNWKWMPFYLSDEDGSSNV